MLAILVVLLGFVRDYLFGNINWIYLTLTEGRANQALDEFQFLISWSPRDINLLKWGLTFLFTALNLFGTWLIVKLAFNNRLFNRITIVTFLSITCFALLLYTISVFIQPAPNLYGVIRTLMGIVQSFVPLMILFPLFKFLPSQEP